MKHVEVLSKRKPLHCIDGCSTTQVTRSFIDIKYAASRKYNLQISIRIVYLFQLGRPSLVSMNFINKKMLPSYFIELISYFNQ